MIQSGIPPVDAHLGGFAEGRVHLLTGGIGAGKTTACLQFLAAGFDAGAVALLTLDRPEDLADHARFIGIDLQSQVRVGRLRLLRFRPDFAWRLAHAAPAAAVVEELRAGIGGDVPPARIAIDPASPFLTDESTGGAGILGVARLLGGIGGTSLVTWPGTITGGDRRLDPLVDDAALIGELERRPGGEFAIRFARARGHAVPSSGVRFRIEPGVGITAPRVRSGRRAERLAVTHNGPGL